MGLYCLLGYQTPRRDETPECVGISRNREVILTLAEDEGAKFPRWEIHQLDSGRTLVKQRFNPLSPSSDVTIADAGDAAKASAAVSSSLPEDGASGSPSSPGEEKEKEKEKKGGKKGKAKAAPDDEQDDENHFGT